LVAWLASTTVVLLAVRMAVRTVKRLVVHLAVWTVALRADLLVGK
jgi:hypothetical protein